MATIWFPSPQSGRDELVSLIRAGHIVLMGQEPTIGRHLPAGAGEPIVVAGGVTELAGLSGWPTRWLAWDIAGEPGFAVAAASAGALAVLPKSAGPDAIEHLVARFSAHPPRSPAPGARRYRAKTAVPVSPDTAVEVMEGVVGRVAIHPEGDEVLLGLHGPGELLIGLPADGCYVELVATTDVVIRARPWASVSETPGVSDRLRDQLARAETWAAIRARSTVELRLLGLLGQLASRFGEASPRGLLIPFRLTNPMLASAIGATRSTVSRSMGSLHRRGLICYAGGPNDRRVIVTPAARQAGGHA